jgi:hypothetical protein
MIALLIGIANAIAATLNRTTVSAATVAALGVAIIAGLSFVHPVVAAALGRLAVLTTAVPVTQVAIVTLLISLHYSVSTGSRDARRSIGGAHHPRRTEHIF